MTIPVWFSDGLILPVRHKRQYVETIIRLILMSGLLSLGAQVHKFTGLLCNTVREENFRERQQVAKEESTDIKWPLTSTVQKQKVKKKSLDYLFRCRLLAHVFTKKPRRLCRKCRANKNRNVLTWTTAFRIKAAPHFTSHKLAGLFNSFHLPYTVYGKLTGTNIVKAFLL